MGEADLCGCGGRGETKVGRCVWVSRRAARGITQGLIPPKETVLKLSAVSGGKPWEQWGLFWGLRRRRGRSGLLAVAASLLDGKSREHDSED